MDRLQCSHFGELLRRHRTGAGLTQGELAERAGLSLRTISDLERGINETPRKDTFSLLLEALDLSERDTVTLKLAARSQPRRTEPPEGPTWGLPIAPTPILGRHVELGEIDRLLHMPEARLITLVGPGGVGKTRLAIEAAACASSSFRHGVRFVGLVSLRDTCLVPSALAAALEVMETPESSPFESVVGSLRERQLLVVIDNFEHVIGAAPLLVRLIQACPLVKLLVTSRTVLRVSGEHTYTVPGLTTPGPHESMTLENLRGYGATQLFLERAHAAGHGFRPTDSEIHAIADICRRLDGLPLAVELAAATVRLMSPCALLRHLDDRLALLTGGPRDAPLHQRTLRGTLDWSYSLLSQDARDVLGLLSVFPAGCPLEAVLDSGMMDSRTDLYDSLSSLVDQSLIAPQQGADPEPRFTMPDITRAYVVERVESAGTIEDLKLRQAKYCQGLLEQAQPHLHGSEQTRWLRRLEVEHDNLRAALLWCLRDGGSSSQAELGLRLVVGLAPYWATRGDLREARQWIELALARNPQAPPALQAKASSRLGLVASMLGEQDKARQSLRRSLELSAEIGDREGMATVHLYLGSLAAHWGDLSYAEESFARSLALQRELNDRRGIARCLTNLGELRLWRGDGERARALCEESLGIAHALGEKAEIAHSTCVLAQVMLASGDARGAQRSLREALVLFAELGEKLSIVYVLDDLAGIAAGLAEGERATRLLGAGQALRESLAAPVSTGEKRRYDKQVESARVLLKEESFAREWREGQSMGLDRAIAYALHGPE